MRIISARSVDITSTNKDDTISLGVEAGKVISGGGDDLGDTIAPVVNIMKILQDLKYDQ